MVQKNFGIYGELAVAARMYLEIGEKYAACFSITEQHKLLHSFELFEFAEADTVSTEELLRVIKLHSRLFDQSFVAVTVIWNNNLATAIPAPLYKDDTAGDFLLVETGCAPVGTLLKDKAGSQVVAYYIEDESLTAVRHYFPGAKHVHKKSLLFGKANTSKEAAQWVNISFYNSEFSVSVYKDRLLQLYRKYQYQTTEDVLYHLLNSIQQTGISKEEAKVYAGGLIDKRSTLFKELNLYVNHLEADNLPVEKLNKEIFAEYPAHYFSPFYHLVV